MPAILAVSYSDAGVAEWLGTGLQSRLRGFESRHSLQLEVTRVVVSMA